MRGLMLAVLLALGACAAEPEWEYISVDSFGVGGSAHKTVNADGSMEGGHLSGGNPPRLYRDAGQMAEPDRAKLGPLLAKLPPAHDAPRPMSGETLEVKLKGGKVLTFVAPFDQPEVAELYKLVGQQRVGGW